MKKTLAAAAVILSAAAAANAATTIAPPPSGYYLWEGELFDTSTTCSGNTVGGAARVRFAPKGFTPQVTKDQLVFFQSRGLSVSQWVAASADGKLSGATQVSATTIDKTGLTQNKIITVNKITVSPFPQPPVAVGSTTVTMTITTTESTASGNCTSTFSANLIGPF